MEIVSKSYLSLLQIVRDIGGYSLGRADLVRRAMGKKKLDVMAEERKNFIYGVVDENGNVLIPGAIRNGVDEKSANKIFDEMAEFAKYAFNKAHAACYAVVAYRTAYLKTYYKSEFFAALLNSFITSLNKISVYINECKRLNIKIVKPDVNKSYSKFTVSGDDIIFGLTAIKNVGNGAVESLVEERNKNGKYKDFIDFCKRINGTEVNKKCIESMIKAGAFDSFGTNRATLLASFENVLDMVNADNRRGLSGQVNMFDLDLSQKDESVYSLINVPEMDKKDLLSQEKDVLGLYVSGHPLEAYSKEIVDFANIKSFELMLDEETGKSNLIDGQVVKFIGVVNHIKNKITKNNDVMAFVTFEDLYGEIETIVFPKTYVQYKAVLYEDNIVKVEGRVNIKEDEISVVALKLETMRIRETKYLSNFNENKKLTINIPQGLLPEELTNLREFIKQISNQKGNMKVEIDNNGNKKEFDMFINERVYSKLKEMIGEENLIWR